MSDKDEYSTKDSVKNSRLEQKENMRANIFVALLVMIFLGGVIYYTEYTRVTALTPDITSELRTPKDTPKTPSQSPSDETRVYDLTKPPEKQ